MKEQDGVSSEVPRFAYKNSVHEYRVNKLLSDLLPRYLIRSATDKVLFADAVAFKALTSYYQFYRSLISKALFTDVASAGAANAAFEGGTGSSEKGRPLYLEPFSSLAESKLADEITATIEKAGDERLAAANKARLRRSVDNAGAAQNSSNSATWGLSSSQAVRKLADGVEMRKSDILRRLRELRISGTAPSTLVDPEITMALNELEQGIKLARLREIASSSDLK